METLDAQLAESSEPFQLRPAEIGAILDQSRSEDPDFQSLVSLARELRDKKSLDFRLSVPLMFLSLIISYAMMPLLMTRPDFLSHIKSFSFGIWLVLAILLMPQFLTGTWCLISCQQKKKSWLKRFGDHFSKMNGELSHHQASLISEAVARYREFSTLKSEDVLKADQIKLLSEIYSLANLYQHARDSLEFRLARKH